MDIQVFVKLNIDNLKETLATFYITAQVRKFKRVGITTYFLNLIDLPKIKTISFPSACPHFPDF